MGLLFPLRHEAGRQLLRPRLLLQKLDLREFGDLLDDGAPVGEIDFADYGQEARGLIEACLPSAKFRRCVQLTESLVKEGKPVIVWCVFLDSIKKRRKPVAAQGSRRLL